MQPRHIWLYRHAESLSNAGEKTHDVTLIPLSARGHAQVSALTASVEEAPDCIISSPFLRAQQTAAPIIARFAHAGADTWPIQEFTYLDPAACVGTSWVERKPRIDAYWARLDPAYVDGPGAESFGDLLDRARAFLDRLAKMDQALTLIVSHGQFMQAARLLAETPDASAAALMARFRAGQASRPFANCERLRMSVGNGGVRVDQRG